MILSDVDCRCKSADIYEPLQPSLERFERRTGAHVELIRIPTTLYEERMGVAKNSSDAPDVVWTSASGLASLARDGRLVSLTPWLKRRPLRFLEFPAWIREQFMVGDQTFGVPLAAEGDLRLHAYSMTAAARDRRHADLAFELIAHLSDEIPLRGLPDVALFSLELLDDGGHPETPLTVHAELKNIGEAPANGFQVVFRIDGEDVVSRNVDGLEIGATKELYVELPRKPRPYFIAAVVDPQNHLAESNKANNTAIGKYSGALTGTPPAPKAVGTQFCIDNAATRTSTWDSGPKVGFDGQNYLIVWHRQQKLDGKLAYNHELRAARVTPSGQILDPGGVVIAPGPKKYNSFHLAFSGNLFFVVWEVETGGDDPGSVIEGIPILSSSGQLVLGSPVVIDNSVNPSWPGIRHVSPDVGFTGSEFLVVYSSVLTDVAPYPWKWQAAAGNWGLYARSVSVFGALKSGRTQLLAYDNSLGPAWPIRLRFVEGQGKGLVVFKAGSLASNTLGVYVMEVTMSGGTPLAAPPTLIDSAALSVIFSKPVPGSFENPRLGVSWPWYLLVWESSLLKPSNYYDPDLYGTIFLPGGTFQTSKPLVQGDSEAWPAVAFDGQNFTVVYQHKVGCLDHPAGVRVSTQGVVGATTIFTTSTFVSSLDLAFGTNNGLMVFWRFNPPSTLNGPDYSDAVCAQFVDKSP